MQHGKAQLDENQFFSKPDGRGGVFYGGSFIISTQPGEEKYLCTSPKLYEEVAGTPAQPICVPDCWGLNEKTCSWSSDFIPIDDVG